MSTSSGPLRVLVVDSHGRGGGRDAAHLLANAGHAVHGCHDADHPSFPCNALTTVGCPLDRHGVDVAVVVREHPIPRPTFLEHGAICALRHDIPLVVTGRTVLSPYDPWASRTVDDGDDLIEVCQQVATTASPAQAAAAVTAAEAVLARHGVPSVAVDVHRRDGKVRAAIACDAPVDRRVAGLAAVRVAAAVRAVAPHAPTIDVSVRCRPEESETHDAGRREGGIGERRD